MKKLFSNNGSVTITALLAALVFVVAASGCGSISTGTPVDNTKIVEDETRDTLENLIDAETTPEVLPEPIPEPEPTETTIKFTIIGDCMFASFKGDAYAGGFAAKALEGDFGYFLGGVDSLFKDDDFTIANLENVLTDDASLKPVWKDHSPAYWYKAPTENINIFKESSVEIANLSNNHTSDYGEKGAADTIAACEAGGILWGNSDKTLYVEKDGIKIAIICNGLWSTWQSDVIVNRIKEASEQSDMQIVYYHGGKERLHQPEEWKIAASRKLVDAGADLVIGNHPHVLQPMEVYNGVPIIYSMGNFCFGGSSRPENRTIVYKYNATFDLKTKTMTSYEDEVIPCYVYTGSTNNWRPEIITDEAIKNKVLSFMNWEISSPV